MTPELLRFYAIEKAYGLDPTFSGCGVRRFKTALLQRLERENDPTLKDRVKKSDARAMQSFYQHYYKKYIQALQNVVDKADHAQLTKVNQTTNVLFGVLKAVNQAQAVEVNREILETHDKVAEKTEIYLPCDILPLDLVNTNQVIIRYPGIQVAVFALRNTSGLPWPKDYKKKNSESNISGRKYTPSHRRLSKPIWNLCAVISKLSFILSLTAVSRRRQEIFIDQKNSHGCSRWSTNLTFSLEQKTES